MQRIRNTLGLRTALVDEIERRAGVEPQGEVAEFVRYSDLIVRVEQPRWLKAELCSEAVECDEW